RRGCRAAGRLLVLRVGPCESCSLLTTAFVLRVRDVDLDYTGRDERRVSRYDACMRIVSLLPSATEIICALGLREQLVGITHECDYPADVADLPRVTTTHIPTDCTSEEIDELVRERLEAKQALYSLNMDVLERLRPDLIVTQALCDVCAVAEREVQ